jgi:MinD superfamily P-loop ATPase
MRIAVLSGKGGTGKTMVSVNLAAVAGEAVYVDCDVEEPNGALFFKPDVTGEEDVHVLVPRADPQLCDGCLDCVRFCRFHALSYSLDRLLVFDEVCHSCGGCSVVCLRQAISEHPRTIGSVSSGRSDRVKVHTGTMDIGEAIGLPIIGRLLEKAADETGDVFIDCPPGSSCMVMESIRDADFCILVSEPTVFGAHNLGMVAELVSTFGKPLGAVLNKVVAGEEDPSERYCEEHGIPILTRIPFDPVLGRLCSDAEVAARADEGYRRLFAGLLEQVREAAA